MSSFSSYIPSTPGLLPKWMLMVSIISIFNTAQCYYGDSLNRRVYPTANARKEVTPLSSRTFGTWTLLTGIVRLYASSRLSDPAWYDLAYVTYLVALGHFGAELLVFKSTKLESGAFPSLVIATGTTIWMGLVRSSYVG